MNVLISIQQPVRAWQIPDAAVETLRSRFPHLTFVHATDDEARARALPDAEIAFTWILNASELTRAAKLRWVHSSAVAVETICLPELFQRGILLTNSRGIQATPIAEHVLAVMLALAKQLPFVTDYQRQKCWGQNDFIGERLPWLLKGRTLGLIGGPELARMKKGAVLINVGRARIVDNSALVDALRSGHLGGASLDVFSREPLPSDDPLWTLPNVILTPHTSGFRQGHWDDVIELFSENLKRFQAGEPVKFRVLPELGY